MTTKDLIEGWLTQLEASDHYLAGVKYGTLHYEARATLQAVINDMKRILNPPTPVTK